MLPVTEAHLVAFIGWLAAGGEAGCRALSSTSIPQHLSAVREMQLHALGVAVLDVLLVLAVPSPLSRLQHARMRAGNKKNSPNVRCAAVSQQKSCSVYGA